MDSSDPQSGGTGAHPGEACVEQTHLWRRVSDTSNDMADLDFQRWTTLIILTLVFALFVVVWFSEGHRCNRWNTTDHYVLSWCSRFRSMSCQGSSSSMPESAAGKTGRRPLSSRPVGQP